MIHAGPEIHSYGADLYLHTHIFLLLGEKYRNFHNQMQAPVAVGLWILNIILLPDKRNIILLEQHVRNGINIINKRTDYPDTGYVIQPFLHRFHREGGIVTSQLLYNAQGPLNARGNVFDGITFMPDAQLVI